MKDTAKPLGECKQAQSGFEAATSQVQITFSGIVAIALQHMAQHSCPSQI
jgi:hypothetical protein